MRFNDGTTRAQLWRYAALAALIVACAAALFVGVERIAFERGLAATLARGRTTLNLASNALEGRLGRYRSLPALVADEGAVVALLSDPSDPDLRLRVDRYFRHIGGLLGASDIYLMTPDGETIAASNYAGPVSFVGQNFSYRPYFKEALATGRGHFFALGTTSGKRGYYFSAAVKKSGRILGVVVFKIDLAQIEASWRGNSEYEIVVTDPEGIIFLSSRKDWLYGSFTPPSAAALRRLRQSRRYAGTRLHLLPVVGRSRHAGADLIALRTQNRTRHYALLSRRMTDAGWNVQVLVDTAPARAQALMFALISLLVAGLVALGVILALRERSRLAERLRIQRSVLDQLEQQVSLRTSDLALANVRLEQEVGERRNTEERLRRTQTDLIQAGKLAALGQMSAALSHEFNQPLAALSVYADNATTCLDRDRPDLLRDNIARMSNLIHRLASLSGHLHSFARRPEEKTRPVALAPALDAVLAILDRRIRAVGAEIAVTIAPGADSVIAGDVRLQQVLLNLVANALDVIEAGAPARVAITAEPEAGGVVIAVRDWGSGVPEAVVGRIFDPFFTTKGPGKGLGLGLSISYNIVKDFGGDLSVANASGGGACFHIRLESGRVAAAPQAQEIQ